MKIFIFTTMILASVIGMADTQMCIYTREEIFTKPVLPEQNPIKYYADVDINGDGIQDLLFSTSVSLGGTGGIPYLIYLGIGTNTYRQITYTAPYSVAFRCSPDGKTVPVVNSNRTSSVFTTGPLALEIDAETKERRLWICSHGSARSGSIAYLYFDRKGNLMISRHITIHGTPSGNGLGDQILNAIFSNEDRKIEPVKITVPQINPYHSLEHVIIDRKKLLGRIVPA